MFYIPGMRKLLIIVSGILILVQCTSRLPDLPTAMAAPSSENQERSSSGQENISRSSPGYWTPTLVGNWSSAPRSSAVSSSRTSSTASSSSQALSAAVSSSGTSIPEEGPLAITECGVAFPVPGGETQIQWDLAGCGGSSVQLFCDPVDEEGCGASLTFDFEHYYAGVGSDVFNLGTHSSTVGVGVLEATCPLLCYLE